MMVADAKKRYTGFDHLFLISCSYGLAPLANLMAVNPKRLNRRLFVEYSKYSSAFFAYDESTCSDILLICALLLGSTITESPKRN